MTDIAAWQAQIDQTPRRLELRLALAQAQHQATDLAGAQATLLAAACLQMVQFHPNDGDAQFQLALALGQTGELQFAAETYRICLILQPERAETYCNAGVTLTALGQPEQAVSLHRRSLQLRPDMLAFRSNAAHALLASGALQEGFTAWEARVASPPRDFSAPCWDGSPFPGKTLLVHAEQGYGDTLQFCRYLVGLSERMGGRVIVECRAPMTGLLRRMPGIATVIDWGQTLPHFDLQIRMPSLAERWHRTTIDVPLLPPYLSIAPDRLHHWQQIIPTGPTKRVGLVWSGHVRSVDPRRAFPPSLLDEILDVPNITFYSLQRDIEALPRPGMVGLGQQIGDFEDMAAAIGCLDLLISVDTAAAHLAGALAHPVWTMLPAAPDWRWLPRDQPNRWYPQMRCYQQPTAGDWLSVVAAIRRDLIAWTSTGVTTDAAPGGNGTAQSA